LQASVTRRFDLLCHRLFEFAELCRDYCVISSGIVVPLNPLLQIEATVFTWFKSDSRRKQIREDRKYLKARARRLLKSYLSSDGPRKQRYYEVVAGAAAACQPGVSDPNLENSQLARATAEAALKIVKLRERNKKDGNDCVETLITDAYATVAVAYRRASAVYTVDQEMQQLGTAAVHLLTMATSYMAAQSADITPRDDSFD
jgi:hypothetical protein